MFFTRVLLKHFVSSKLAISKPRIEQFEGKYYCLTGDATAHNEIEQHILAERDHHKQYAELVELELNGEALQSNKDTPELELTNINRQIQEATIRLRKLRSTHAAMYRNSRPLVRQLKTVPVGKQDFMVFYVNCLCTLLVGASRLCLPTHQRSQFQPHHILI